MQFQCLKSGSDEDNDVAPMSDGPHRAALNGWFPGQAADSAMFGGGSGGAPEEEELRRGQVESLYVHDMRLISRQLEDLRTQVLATMQEQLQQFERERSVQMESNCRAIMELLKEHREELLRAPAEAAQRSSNLFVDTVDARSQSPPKVSREASSKAMRFQVADAGSPESSDEEEPEASGGREPVLSLEPVWHLHPSAVSDDEADPSSDEPRPPRGDVVVDPSPPTSPSGNLGLRLPSVNEGEFDAVMPNSPSVLHGMPKGPLLHDSEGSESSPPSSWSPDRSRQEKPSLKTAYSSVGTKSKAMDEEVGAQGMTLWKRARTVQMAEEKRQMVAEEEQAKFAVKQSRKQSVELLPESRSQTLLRTVVHSKQFGVLVLIMIIANAVYIGTFTQATLENEIHCFRNPSDSDCHNNFTAYRIGEGLFAGFFTAELTLRFLEGPLPTLTRASRVHHFFRGADYKWNLFDLVLVITQFVDICLEQAQISGGSGQSETMQVIKMLRVVRLLRIMRVIRALRFFRSLRLMLGSIIHSVNELFWVFILLFFIVYMVTIFIEGAIVEHFRTVEPHRAEEYSHDFLITNFGTIKASSTSLFMAISGGGDWQEFYVPLNKVNYQCGWVFLIYIFFVVFGVLNVVTGAFVDSMRLVSQRDNDLVIEQELKKENEFKTEIKSIFEEADTDASGTLSWDEFESHLQDERVRAYFTSLELDISEARALFVLLDVEETDEVPIDKFITGCLRMRGDAKSIDVNMILYENEKMLCKITSFTDFAEDMFERLEKGVNDARRQLGEIGGQPPVEKKHGAGPRGGGAPAIQEQGQPRRRSFAGAPPALPLGMLQQFGGDPENHQDDEVAPAPARGSMQSNQSLPSRGGMSGRSSVVNRAPPMGHKRSSAAGGPPRGRLEHALNIVENCD